MTRHIAGNKNHDSKLGESEARFARIIELAHDAIISIDESQKIILFNKGAERVFGYTANEIIGRSVDILLPERFRANHGEYIHGFNRSDDTTRVLDRRPEVIGIRKNGEEFPAEASISKLVMEGEMIYTCLMRDITNRKRRDEEIELLQTMIQSISEAPDFKASLKTALQKVCQTTNWNYGEAWIPSKNELVLECSLIWNGDNRNLSKFRTYSQKIKLAPGIGLPGRVLASRKAEWISDVTSASKPAFIRAKAALDAGLGAALSVPIITDDNVLAVLCFFMLTSREKDDRMVDLILAVSAQLGSVVQRKWAEEELKRSHRILLKTNEELQRALEEEKQLRNRLLNAERLASLGEMSARITHEINNPLTVISAQAQIQLTNELDPEIIRSFRIIKEKSERINALTRGYMNLGKPEDLKTSNISLGKVIKTTVDSLRPLGLLKNIKVEEEYVKNEPTIIGDAGRLEQVFRNLIINAVHALKERSSGKITAGTRLSDDGKSVDGFVSDNGAGIEPDDMDKIFEHYYTTKEEGVGTGLGLVICKEIVEVIHGGKIKVESTPEGGSVFHIEIPIDKYSKLKKKVLIIDDEAYITTLFCKFLTEKGLLVRTAGKSRDALRICSEFAPDLVISNIEMQDMNYLNLMDKILQMNTRQLFIMTSRYTLSQDIKETLITKEIPLLKKPVNLEKKLWSTVLKELDKVIN